MPRREKGLRVGVIFGTRDGVVQFLGYGTYQGEEVPVSAVGFLADALREVGSTNPRIDLDNGETVWGCECWWGTEAVVRQRMDRYEREGFTIAHVSSAELRKSYEEAKKG